MTRAARQFIVLALLLALSSALAAVGAEIMVVAYHKPSIWIGIIVWIIGSFGVWFLFRPCLLALLNWRDERRKGVDNEPT